PQKSGQDVGMSDRARALRHSPPGQGFAPTPSTPCQMHVKKRARFWCRNATKGLGLLGDARSALKRHLTH
ncbi:hypothetical protein, partial [Escherichia coli]|uniref:hypothetical protein n=1 Tax=Escherichia coli TaxID=562 RepID=UPI001FF5DAA1